MRTKRLETNNYRLNRSGLFILNKTFKFKFTTLERNKEGEIMKIARKKDRDIVKYLITI